MAPDRPRDPTHDDPAAVAVGAPAPDRRDEDADRDARFAEPAPSTAAPPEADGAATRPRGRASRGPAGPDAGRAPLWLRAASDWTLRLFAAIFRRKAGATVTIISTTV